MTSDEIENKRVEKLKQINVAKENVNVLQDEAHRLETILVEIREVYDKAKHTYDTEKNRIEKELLPIKDGIRKGKNNIAVMNTEEKILTSEYWKSRNHN